MCGIAGFIGFKNGAELAEMANRIQQHRGPDYQGSWSDGHLFLAHQRLSIIDLSERANQPFEKGELIIVFNGEIYNYRALKKLLATEHNVVFRSDSDTEVILEMFRCYGENCLNFLEGMFAFALYNKTSKNLFLARDHFGIKPLFYTCLKNTFAFASELKTLSSIPGFNKDLNRKALVNCINYLWLPGNDTIFNDCKKLAPAHFMTVAQDLKPKVTSYWQLEDSVFNISENDLVHRLRLILKGTIERHMVADVPVSSFLSGGLDSSLLSVLAKNINSELSTYTIGQNIKDKKIERMPEDEKYARKLALLHDFDHHEIVIQSDIIHQLPQMVRALDEPIGDPAAINTYLICKAAKERGVKVLLSGMGADEIFFGYRRQKATLFAQNYNRLPALIRNFIGATINNLPVSIGNRGLKFFRWAKRFISLSGYKIDETYRLSYSYYSPAQLSRLFNDNYAKEIKTVQDDHNSVFNSLYNGDVINQMCYTDIQYFMNGLNLTYSDRASMAASVELRVPFIDKQVIEFAMHIPGKYKFKRYHSKYILKKAAEAYLPKNIIYRPKASFGAPIRSWISNDLKEMVNDLLSEDRVKQRGLFNPGYISTIISNDRKGLEDNAYQIYQLLTLELWFQEYLDK